MQSVMKLTYTLSLVSWIRLPVTYPNKLRPIKENGAAR
jgi:hypothetical protein